MNSMNARLKAFGFGKRKSPQSIQPQPSNQDLSANHEEQQQSQTAPPAQISQPPSQGHAPSPSASSPAASASNISMNHAPPGNRPPSYTTNLQGQPPLGRTSPFGPQGSNRTPPTQMVGGPPPINTGAHVPGYPPHGQAPGGPPPMGGPPGYGGAPAGYPPGPPPPVAAPQPAGGAFGLQQQYRRPGDPAEVEGNSHSKAQLIVGIDFVGALSQPPAVGVYRTPSANSS